MNHDDIRRYVAAAIRAATICLVCVSALCNAMFASTLAAGVVGSALSCAAISADLLKSQALSFVQLAWSRKNYVAALGGVALTLVAVLYSFVAGLGLSAETRTHKVGGNENIMAAYDVAARTQKRLDSEVAMMKQNKRWTATSGCTNATAEKSIAFCHQYGVAVVELKKSAAVITKGKPKQADPQASAIANLFGVSIEDVQTYLPYLLPLLLELSTVLGFVMADVIEGRKQPAPASKATMKPQGPFTREQAEAFLVTEFALGRKFTQKQLSEAWSRSSSWVTEALQHFERLGLVSRPKEGRYKMVVAA